MLKDARTIDSPLEQLCQIDKLNIEALSDEEKESDVEDSPPNTLETRQKHLRRMASDERIEPENYLVEIENKKPDSSSKTQIFITKNEKKNLRTGEGYELGVTTMASTIRNTRFGNSLKPQRTPSPKVDKEECQRSNADLMRAIMGKKISRNKTFFQLVVSKKMRGAGDEEEIGFKLIERRAPPKQA